MSTYGCKKKTKFLKRTKPNILPFFSVNTPTNTVVNAPKPIQPKVQTPPINIAPKKITVITEENKSKLSKLLNLNSNSLENNFSGTNIKLRDNKFSDEQLFSSWFSFTRKIPHLPDIHHVFNKNPEIEGNNVKILVTSSIVENKLIENLELLKKHLCNDLKNDYIDVIIEVDKTAASNLNLNAKDKAKLMNEKNQYLLTLFKEWKLKLY